MYVRQLLLNVATHTYSRYAQKSTVYRMNHWLKILEAYQEGKFPNYFYGLTPRFIIGACQIPIGKKFETEELAYKATKKMFDEMRAFNYEGKIVVSNRCGIHNGPVMSLSNRVWSDSAIATSFEEIWGRYCDEIVDGDYHIDLFERKIVEDIFSV